MWMAPSISLMPPSGSASVGLVAFLSFLTPSTITDSIYGGDNTTLALVLASNDLNFIAFLNVGLHRVWVVLLNNPGQYLQHGAPTLLFSRRNVKHNLANVLFF